MGLARWTWLQERARRRLDALDFRAPPSPRRKRRGGDEGSAPVAVEPDRPRQGQGGAAAPLTFEQP